MRSVENVFSSCSQTPLTGIVASIYDVYNKGIHNAILTIRNFKGAEIYTIQKRDVRTNEWSQPIAAARSEVANDEAFKLWGAIAEFPARLQQVEEICWGSNVAIGWPNADSIYIRHHTLTGFINGKEFTAYFWALKDGSQSVRSGMMDLIITPDNRLIAAVDLPYDIWMVKRGYENLTALKRWLQSGISPAKHGCRHLDKFMVRMSDGVKLATDVFLPNDDQTDGRYPVILMRTPYGIYGVMDNVGHYLESWQYCARGYAVVLQACRGTSSLDPPECRSEGVWEWGVNEPKDAADTLDWMVKQSWCNGNVGMAGLSYISLTQWTAAMSGNPALKCIIPEVTGGGKPFPYGPYVGGGFGQILAPYLFRNNLAEVKPGLSWDEIIHHRPPIEIDTFATGRQFPMWRTMMEHWRYDDYWKQRNWYLSEYKIDVPALHITGWFDDAHPCTRAEWELMARNKRKHQRLVVGPWSHLRNGDRQLNGFNFGIDSIRDDLWVMRQKWYDHFLKGLDNDVEDIAVEYFVLGANEWRAASRWPPEGMQFQKWYLHSHGKAATLTTDGMLSAVSPTADEPPDTYEYNPENPPTSWIRLDEPRSATVGGNAYSYPYDYGDIDARHDVAVYQSPPLQNDLTIVGDVMVVLYASCDVLDTDWWVRLEDIGLRGDSMSLLTHTLRARFRNLEDKWFHSFGSNFEKEELLSGDPSEIVRYEISLKDIAATFKKGHRIRLAVMNACDHFCFPNSNTGKDEAYVTETVVGTMTIHHDAERPSCLMLPVMTTLGKRISDKNP